MRLASVVRHPKDWYPVALVTCVLAAQLTAFFTLKSAFAAGVFGFFSLFFLVPILCSAHHHYHAPIFRIPFLNRLYEIALYLQTGLSSQTWTVQHNLGHHRNYFDQGRDAANWLRPDGREMGRFEFGLHIALTIYPYTWRHSAAHPAIARRFRNMLVASNLVLALLVALHPLNALLIFVIPMALMLFHIGFGSYPQHAGLHARDPYLASRNHVSRFFQFYTFNTGFHTAHHLNPGMHWSELPAFHEAIRHRIPARLIVGSKDHLRGRHYSSEEKHAV